MPFKIGGLAQLARAFGWQPKGHRFDSDILHKKPPRFGGFFFSETFSRFHHYLNTHQKVAGHRHLEIQDFGLKRAEIL